MTTLDIAWNFFWGWVSGFSVAKILEYRNRGEK